MSLDPANPDLAARVRAVFRQGRLLALPTETVYGLAAPIDRPELVERIFELKGRPADNPLIVHVGTMEQARRCVSVWPALAETLAQRFWPGPLTLVLPRSELISDRITAGRATVAVRMPDHPAALAVLRALDVPLVAPSANLFTRLSPTRPEDVRAVFSAEQVELIDGGACRVGIESTIVGINAERRRLVWLRPGMIDRALLESMLPPAWRMVNADAALSPDAGAQAPGRMKEHYRPARPLTVALYADEAERRRHEQAVQAEPGAVCIELPTAAAPAAAALYQTLRSAEAGAETSIVLLLPAGVLDRVDWEGVCNRLRKAAVRWLAPGQGFG